MSQYVLDANVPIKWFVPEDLTPQAVRLLEGDHQFIVPDLVYLETGNALWKKVRRRQITASEARVVLDGIVTAPFTTYPARELVSSALELALQLDSTLSHASSLGLPLLPHCPLPPADLPLHPLAPA